MVIFASEVDLVESLDQHDILVRECVSGCLSFSEFSSQYDSYYWSHALDGHESDDEELSLLDKYRDRIALHEAVALEVLSGVCSDADARLDGYIQARRFGSDEAVRRLRDIASRYL